ncbi:unnamed protein product [Clonostachys rosea f. rosea IK726]|uniref:Amidase domain-containing protein n=2 Tax=Bionectria ochroleuca TaxID=29856 RepID=A0A0B7K6I0_BIOOC|nr:unnamed protein product [Clonostachys rosea f. rosea IK726]
MSIVAITEASSSADLQELAVQLGIEISNSKDLGDYLLLLKSFEVVLKEIEDGQDCVHPSLKPQAVCTSRQFWRPGTHENPFNAWSHRCELVSTNPSSDVLKNRTIAIKDNISVGGLPTTLGAPSTAQSDNQKRELSGIDATVVSRILEAGAVIKGTSTCECFCASPLSFTSNTGPVHNPRLHGFTAGGSSSGSCVLVAAHLLASESNEHYGETAELAIGSDQAGSVRIPASFNGIYGLKPTFGLIPYTGAASMSPMIDHIGPLASRLEDIAILLEVMAGYDGLDSRMSPEAPLRNGVKPYSKILANFREQCQLEPGTKLKWSVGLLKESFEMDGVTPEVRRIVHEAATRCFTAAGVTVKDISVPMHRDGPIIWTASTRPSMSGPLCQGKTPGYLSFIPPHLQPQWPPSQDLYEAMTKLNPALVNIWFSEKYAEKFSTPAIQVKAHRKVFELRDAYDRALNEVDVLITPCAPTVAMPHPKAAGSEDQSASILDRLATAVGITSNTCPFNVTGHPGLNVPCGFGSVPNHPDIQLPVSMQLVGRRWMDEELLQVAALFEKGKELCSK